MVLDKEKHSGAQDMALDLQIGRVISYSGKNPPLGDLDCVSRFIVLFIVQLLCLILFDFKNYEDFENYLKKSFQWRWSHSFNLYDLEIANDRRCLSRSHKPFDWAPVNLLVIRSHDGLPFTSSRHCIGNCMVNQPFHTLTQNIYNCLINDYVSSMDSEDMKMTRHFFCPQG